MNEKAMIRNNKTDGKTIYNIGWAILVFSLVWDIISIVLFKGFMFFLLGTTFWVPFVAWFLMWLSSRRREAVIAMAANIAWFFLWSVFAYIPLMFDMYGLGPTLSAYLIAFAASVNFAAGYVFRRKRKFKR